MKKIYDLAVKTGTYQKDNETKNKYENIGAIMENDKGKFMFLKRSFNPAGIEVKEGSDSIIISMFEPKKSEKNSIEDFDDLNTVF